MYPELMVYYEAIHFQLFLGECIKSLHIKHLFDVNQRPAVQILVLVRVWYLGKMIDKEDQY